jgi:predicted dehydrogenase
VLRIGILGAAGIAPQAIIRPVSRRDDVVIAAVASRSLESAIAYGTKNGIPVTYGRYEAMLSDESIDLVYNALPPSEHARWSIAALEAGKHVLCEKPIAMNAAEAIVMAGVAMRTGKRLVEAFHDRYHPLSDYLLSVRSSGELGQILSVDATFTAPIPFDPISIRHDPAVGGGALMDLGCYPVHWVRFFVGEEPVVVSATSSPNELGADETIEASLRFPSGVDGNIFASMVDTLPFSATLVVTGSRGTLDVTNPVLPHNGHSVRITTDGIMRTLTIGGDETYDYQLAAVIGAILEGDGLPTESADFVANMRAMDAIYAAAGVRRGTV